MRLPPLYHYSDEVVDKVVQKELYDLEESSYLYPRPNGKPFGFWVSVRNDWERWCRGEQYSEDALCNKHKVKLVNNHNLLIINNINDFDEFTKTYGYNHFEEMYEKFKLPDHILEKCSPFLKEMMKYKDFSEIRWKEIKPKYQGILIYPYFNIRRHAAWYYGWDCASGCIWDTSCIQEIKLIKKKIKQ